MGIACLDRGGGHARHRRAAPDVEPPAVWFDVGSPCARKVPRRGPAVAHALPPACTRCQQAPTLAVNLEHATDAHGVDRRLMHSGATAPLNRDDAGERRLGGGQLAALVETTGSAVTASGLR